MTIGIIIVIIEKFIVVKGIMIRILRIIILMAMAMMTLCKYFFVSLYFKKSGKLLGSSSNFAYILKFTYFQRENGRS